MIEGSLATVASWRDLAESLSGAVGMSADTAVVAVVRGIFIAVALVLVPAFFLSLLVPFLFLAAWVARKPPKFGDKDKWLGIYLVVAGGLEFAVRLALMAPDITGIGLAVWQVGWGLMLIWAAAKRAAPQTAA